MGGMDWRKAREPRALEAAIGEGFVRNNGEVTPILAKGNLAKQAAAAEADWMKKQGLEIGRKGYIVKKKPKEKPKATFRPASS